MNTLIQISHDLKSNTLEATWFDEAGNRGCQNFHPLQIDDFKVAAGEHAQKYIDLADWTPDYIASVVAEEQRLADEAKAKADAEAAEADTKRKQAEKEAFDADVARQVAVMEEAGKIIKAKKAK